MKHCGQFQSQGLRWGRLGLGGWGLRASYLPAFFLAHVPTYPRAYLPTCLRTWLPIHPPTYLPTDLPAYPPSFSVGQASRTRCVFDPIEASGVLLEP